MLAAVTLVLAAFHFPALAQPATSLPAMGGFGAVTHHQIPLDVFDYTEGDVLTSLTNNTPPGRIVTLKGLDIEGVGNGIDGIRFIQAGTRSRSETSERPAAGVRNRQELK
jgi:hypothetical protein